MRSVPEKAPGGKGRAGERTEPARGDGTGTPRTPLNSTTGAAGANERFLETACKDGEITQTTLKRKEVLSLDVEDRDVHIDEVFGNISIRTKHGKYLKYFGEIPGLGDKVGRPFLDELMWQPGELLTIDQLIKNPKLQSLVDRAVRATRLKALRTAFGDTPEAGFYFIRSCHPWRICWNAERSWRIVERLAQAPGQSALAG